MDNLIHEIIAVYWIKIFMFVLLVGRAYCQQVNVTFIDDAVTKGSVCLDGSPGAYHYDKGSAEGANSWMIYLQGGGWCGTKDDCLARAQSGLGSTKNASFQFFGGILSQDQDINPDFYNWNRVFIRYCDGASFLADVEAIDPETNLHLRGAKIFRSTMEELLAKGMINVTDAILVGNSAGGLATILNCDRFQTFLPNARRVKCISDSGFFIRAQDLPGLEERESFYAEVTSFHELAKSLPMPCTSRLDPSLCLFPENVVGDIQTPIFLLNSAFDTYQINVKLRPYPREELGWQNCKENLKSCTNSQLQLIKDFRTTFLKTLNKVAYIPSRGMFIDSCYIHDAIYINENWSSIPTIQNKTISEAVGNWFFSESCLELIDTENDFPLNCNV